MQQSTFEKPQSDDQVFFRGSNMMQRHVSFVFQHTSAVYFADSFHYYFFIFSFGLCVAETKVLA
jgi:hypothetical protein